MKTGSHKASTNRFTRTHGYVQIYILTSDVQSSTSFPTEPTPTSISLLLDIYPITLASASLLLIPSSSLISTTGTTPPISTPIPRRRIRLIAITRHQSRIISSPIQIRGCQAQQRSNKHISNIMPIVLQSADGYQRRSKQRCYTEEQRY